MRAEWGSGFQVEEVAERLLLDEAARLQRDCILSPWLGSA